MVSSINSSMGSTVWANNSSMQRMPQGRDPFEVSDTDGDGTISQTELDAIAAGIEEVTGTAIDSDITSYDTDEDGSLSNEELMEMLTGNGFGPPEMQGGPPMQGPPPPPPPSEDAVSAYIQEDSEDPFDIADADGDGIVTEEELATAAADIEEMTGTTIVTEDAISEYDTDASGTLEQDEYMAMLAGSGLTPPGEMQGPPSPPPLSSEEAIAAYSQFESDDPMFQLLDILSSYEEGNSTSTSISVTS